MSGVPARTKRLVILGAGAKGIAIAAKAAALREAAVKVPLITLIERHSIGSAWNGEYGYTNGSLKLCTPPEKDLGFPYGSRLPGSEAACSFFWQHFSWAAYQLSHWSDRTLRGQYCDLVDNGHLYGRPTHREWYDYISWVFNQIRHSVEFVTGEVESFAHSGNQWDIKVRVPSGNRSAVLGDGLVVTGTGPAKRFPQQSTHERIMDGESVWRKENWTRLAGAKEGKDAAPIVVIGSGETAATIVLELAKIRPRLPIIIVNRSLTLFSRGEGFFENRLFSSVETEEDEPVWERVDLRYRVEAIRRTDHGVISPASLEKLAQVENLRHRRIKVTKVRIGNDGLPEIVGKSLTNDIVSVTSQFLIVSTGFDPWWFIKLAEGPEFRLLKELHKQSDFKSRRTLESQSELINNDLALPVKSKRTKWPKLHLPMVSALAQGPGFPNLTCLGELSDRILGAYCIPTTIPKDRSKS